MAFMHNIIARRGRARAHSDFGSMSDRQLEDLGVCRADLRAPKPSTVAWPTRPNESWPAS